LSPPSWVQAVLFDLGGTLIDYLGGAPSWPAMEMPGVLALHACLTAAGFSGEAQLFSDRFIHAMDTRWRAATAGRSDPPTIHSLVEEMCNAAQFALDEELRRAAAAAYYAPIAARAVAATGARETLAWLRGHGIRLGLISNTLWPGEAHRLDLDRYELLPHLDALAFSSECGLWKPDPRIFELVLGQLGVTSDHAVFVGDRLAEDVRGAQRAGLRAIWLDNGENNENLEPGAVMPEATIRTLTELAGAFAAM
jgi:putative hydrolase of the HAD superfamily